MRISNIVTFVYSPHSACSHLDISDLIFSLRFQRATQMPPPECWREVFVHRFLKPSEPKCFLSINKQGISQHKANFFIW